MLPSEPANLFQVKTVAGPSSESEKQGPQISPASAGGSPLSSSRNDPLSGEKMDMDSAQISPASAGGSPLGSSRNGPLSGEKMAVDSVRARQSKAAGLKINTETAESAAQPPPGNESKPGEELYADFVKTHEEFRKELDNLARELNTANKRADTTELRAQKAENKVYQANNVGFANWKKQEDDHRKENEKQQRANECLRIRCDALEDNIRGKIQAIDDLKWELKREEQRSALVRLERA